MNSDQESYSNISKYSLGMSIAFFISGAITWLGAKEIKSVKWWLTIFSVGMLLFSIFVKEKKL